MKALNGYDISKLWEMFAVGDSQISSRGKKKGQKRKVKVNKIQTEKNKDKTLRQDTESCILADCSLCPRNCHVDRTAGKTGYCGMDQKVKIARAALHMWEEPCISGKEGSGAVFFSGCSLGCVFCQNRMISRGQSGKVITTERLAEIFLDLQRQKANNINLVTAGHFLVQVREALILAKARGLTIPVVYNSSGYEKAEMLRLLDGLVDIYLPDFKYMDPFLAAKYSHAPDYPQTAKAAIAEMVRQKPRPVFAWEEKRGEDVPEEACEGAVMKRGVIVRQLLLPGCLKDARNIVRYLYETYQNKIYVSLMSQYTPLEHVRDYPELAHRVSRRTYDRYVDAAIALGITQAFIQEPGVAKESFIPDFSNAEGV